MIKYAEKFMDLFTGLNRVYGTYDLSKTKTRDGKMLGKAVTVHKPVTLELWKDHLDGREGIGIVPIRDDSSCQFGAIDIDVYDGLDVKKIIEEIEANDLPLIPCRSKSGGLHCFCFLKEAVPAALMRDKLGSFAAYLGFGDTEIFPKQSEILSDRGDIGQWINMPYFEGQVTKRYAIKPDLSPMTMDEFIAAAEKHRLTAKEFEAFRVATVTDISDGPPCLQYLVTQGFAPGTRNDGLFNIGVYLRKSNPDSWETAIDGYNIKYMTPPLTSNEVQAVIKSLKKKGYNYTCQRPPIKSFCNSPVCRARTYGIGQVVGMPVLTGLTKYNSNPPIWFVNIDGGHRVELMTEDLQSQFKFQRRIMDVMNTMPTRVSENIWQGLIQNLMTSVTIIEAPSDASPRGQLLEHLEKFCTSRAQARTKEEILLGKPWTDSGKHFFRVSDFMLYLERQRFKEYKVNQVCTILKDLGGEHQFFKIKNKGVNTWAVPEFTKQEESFKTPEIDGENVF